MRSPDAEALYHEIALQLHKADPKYAELEARPRSASRLVPLRCPRETDAASMLCRDEDEVRQKAKQLGLVERQKRW